MINIINIQGDKIEFKTYDEFKNCTIKLLSFSDEQEIFSTTFEKCEKGPIYWISHFKVFSEPIIKMLLYDQNQLTEDVVIVKKLIPNIDEKLKNLNYIKSSEIDTSQNKFIIFKKKELQRYQNSKKILIRIDASGMGDVLCSTPTIRKISQTYSQKIDVMTKRFDVLEKNPYINKLLHSDEEVQSYDEIFDTFNFSIKFNKPNFKTEFTEKPMEIKMSNFEARQLHALGVGLTLYPEEMHYDFIPDEPTVKSKLIDKNTLVLHVTESWPSRTWSPQKWQNLINLIKEKTNFKICLIGRSHSELDYFGVINKNVIDLKNVDYDFTIRGENINQSDNDRKSLSEMWHILNNSYGLISFDSGPIHLAGVTDSWIFQIGASVRYEKTAPYRNQSQNYKFNFIGGECKLMCASDPKYAVKEWGSINSNPYYPRCQEGYKEFKCHPTPEMIIDKIIASYSI